MTAKLVSISAIFLSCAFAGCFGTYQRRAEWENALSSRARFELNCENIKVTALTQETFGATDAPLYQGVEGCGQRVVYVATISGYVLNSDKSTGAIQAQPPPQPTPMPVPPPPH